MAKKEFMFYGKTVDEVKGLSLEEFSQLVPSSVRRKIKRGFTDQEKKLIKKVKNKENNIETHCRDMIILPEMIGITIRVYKGKEFFPVAIDAEMLGHRLGEFALTRNNVSHSAPGIGATRSSSSLSVK